VYLINSTSCVVVDRSHQRLAYSFSCFADLSVSLYTRFCWSLRVWPIMSSWIKKSLSCFHHDKRRNDSRCKCNKNIGSISDKNIQCNFDEEFNRECVGNLVDDTGLYLYNNIMFRYHVVIRVYFDFQDTVRLVNSF